VAAIIREYFESQPDGEDVTLRVLERLGRDRVIALGGGVGKLDATKQDIGRLVAIQLVQEFGPSSVLTHRGNDEHAVSTRAVRTPGLEWVSRYTPHRVQSQDRKCRIVLDTNTVRYLVQGLPAGTDVALLLDLDALDDHRGSHPVSIADPAWAELLAQLLRGSIPFKLWSEKVKALDKVLDTDLPVLPSGHELSVMAGLTKDPSHDPGKMYAYYGASWRYTASATSVESFSHPHFYDEPGGQRMQMGPLPADRPAEVIADRGGGWSAYVDKVRRNFRESGDSAHDLDELREQFRAVLLRELPPAAVDRLSLVAGVLARHAQRAIKDPNYLAKTNDALDVDILYAVALPAIVCTTDGRLLNLARETNSSDAHLVKSPSELIDWLKADTA
jgi:hypothetical protein